MATCTVFQLVTVADRAKQKIPRLTPDAESEALPVCFARTLPHNFLTMHGHHSLFNLFTLLIVVMCGTTAASTTSVTPNKPWANTGPSISVEGGSEPRVPRVEDWPHRPVFLSASENTQILGLEEDEALPLGIPFEFETPLFKGRMLVRLRNATSVETESHAKYFSGRKRLMQTVVQGRFKKPVSMDEVYVGSVFKEPIRLVPPPSIMRIMQSLLSRAAPGVVLDLASEQPKVVTLYAGTAQTVSVDKPGAEPDIMAADLPENTNIIGKAFKSIKHRKNYLSIPKKAAKYNFDTEHVYTLHHYDHAMDYAEYKMKLPMYNYDLSKAIGPQPMSLSAVTTSGETMFHFDVWHESVYKMRFP